MEDPDSPSPSGPVAPYRGAAYRGAAYRGAALAVADLADRLLPDAASLAPEAADMVPLIGDAAREIASLFDEAAGSGEGGDPALPAERKLRHDYSNKLQTVVGFSTLLLLEPGVKDEARASLERIQELAREMVRWLEPGSRPPG